MPKLSSYDDAGALDGTETVPLVVNGVNKTTTTQILADLGGGSGGETNLIAAADVANTGETLSSYNVLSCVRTEEGRYTVTWTPGFFTDVPVISVHMNSGLGAGIYAIVNDVNEDSCEILVLSDPVTHVDTAFVLIAVQPGAGGGGGGSVVETTGSFTMVLTGFSGGSPEAEFSYVKTGRHVTIFSEIGAEGESNNTDLSATGTPIPAAIRPAVGCFLPCFVRNGGSLMPGFILLDPTGAVEFGIGVLANLGGEDYLDMAGSNFLPSGTKGVPGGFSATYIAVEG